MAFDPVSEPRIQAIGESGCWIWTGTSTSLGYGELRLNKKRHYAHRFSYQIHKGQIPDGLVVRHQCDIPACVNPEHLKLGTQRQNVIDSVVRGRANRPKGARNGSAKLTPEQVREAFLSNDSDCEIARRLSVHSSTIRNIRLGRVWRSATADLRQ